ncbi:glycogen synthase GlgA [candidate division KSB1 bacterium]|nr:MAG: glycogen synthase GlgA [candidate division KSB1 bacterium]
MKKLKILFLSSEVYPFAKTGGLADVSGSLPKALKELGHEIRVIMPKYKMINERKYVLREVIRLKDITIDFGGKKITFNVKSAFIPDSKIQTYFIDYKKYFYRDGLYTDPDTKKDYPDNALRFSFFSRSVLETLKLLFWQPHIIHCNDWQTGLVPFYLNTIFKDDSFFKKSYTVLTIHNLSYQGIFDNSILDKIEVSDSLFYPGSPVEYFGKINFLKAGICFADYITTVSENYAKEIQNSSEYGCGLEGVLREKSDKLTGILNGVDYSVWNPETDKYIPENYNYSTLKKKYKNKLFLLKKVGFEYNDNVPLIGVISRLTDQKGFDILVDIIDEIFKMDVQMVILGTGEKKYHKMLSEMQKRFSERMKVFLKFDEKLAHLIEAGCDIFLMPSKFEPSGLNQLYSLKYGTVPVVRKTGGLADSVVDFNSSMDGKGNGFIFEKYSSRELLEAIKRAVECYRDSKTWKKIIKNGMKEDFSWLSVAKKYSKLYEKILKK